ncbi:MAG: beta-lactamase family protein [Candidatus Eiseniibacteriota bacterium]|nr:MAG: beta-lactamase family protein [Candidatus Eisenbacteria bacterium]
MATFPYEDEIDPAATGMNRVALEKAVSFFERQQLSGACPGGQLILRRHGTLVLNRVFGIARGLRSNEPVPPFKVQPQTPFPVLSAGKPLAAIAIAMLEDRGLLDVAAPVSRVLPEFETRGKEEISTLDVLTHRAGILLPDLAKNPHLWGDRHAVLSSLKESEPSYRRGIFAYMPWEYGWILSEIMLKVDGRTLPDFVREEISAPLGLPALQYGLAGRDLNSLAFSYWLGKPKAMVAGVNVAESFEKTNNSAEMFNSRNPAVSLVTDAASLAAFYEFLVDRGVARSGKQLISKGAIQKYTTRGIRGWDRSNRTFLTVGRGFVLGTRLPSIYGWWNTQRCFGHAGGYCSVAFGDYETGITVAIVTNGNRGPYDFARRLIGLAHRLRRACR